MTVGVKVTLRQDKMWEFLDRLFNVALPRVRDFRGINANSFDGRGNYAFGIKEQLIFPEIEYDKIDADPRHGYRDLHHCQDGRRGQRAADAWWALRFYRLIGGKNNG